MKALPLRITSRMPKQDPQASDKPRKQLNMGPRGPARLVVGAPGYTEFLKLIFLLAYDNHFFPIVWQRDGLALGREFEVGSVGR
jgi:hypothetical protein